MTNDERNFSLFWNNELDASHKESLLSDMKINPYLLNKYISLISGKVSDDDCDLLVNLWWSIKQTIGLDTDFNFRQIEIGIDSEGGSLDDVRDLIDCIRGDMRHGPNCRVRDLELHRILPCNGKVSGKVEGTDKNTLSRSKWALFLNDNHEGGSLYFPTRRVVVKPQAGIIVRWPSAIPHGIGPINGRDPAFMLTGESSNVPEEMREDVWTQKSEIMAVN